MAITADFSWPQVRTSHGHKCGLSRGHRQEWDEANPGQAFDPDYFSREILPRLATVKLADIMEAAGVSKSYASTIRSGRFTPHVSTWTVLGALAEAEGEATTIRAPRLAERSTVPS